MMNHASLFKQLNDNERCSDLDLYLCSYPHYSSNGNENFQATVQSRDSRQQHTLESIEKMRSCSRSPIVAPSDTVETTGHSDLVQPRTRRAFSTIEAPIKLISSTSFERRRSIFEINTDLDISEQRPSNVSECDELSLDHILAELQSGVRMSEPLIKATDDSTYINQSNRPCRDNQIDMLENSQQPTSSLLNKTTQHSPLKSGGMRKKKSNDNSGLPDARIESDDTKRKIAPIKNGRPTNRSFEFEKKQHEIESGFEVAWLDFTYSVEPNIFEDPRWGRLNSLFHKERRTILKGLSGGFKSGQMVALMGPSGAGKTCLLESIAGVRLTGIGGRLCLRGRRKAQLVIVPQYDDFLPQFTVEEIITYGSRMKNKPGTDHSRVANEVIEQLGLQVCRSNNIQRCSGGQRKRVAIAQELVSKPNILILDEPTSGLDSSCCYHTMKVLRDVLDQSVKTKEPMAIVSTIHQPSAKVFKMFDLVYLLSKTGLTAYSGPPGELLPTIMDVTGLECPQYSNPSDFMIEIVAFDYGEDPVNKLLEFEMTKAKNFVRDFDNRAGSSGDSGDVNLLESTIKLMGREVSADGRRDSNNYESIMMETRRVGRNDKSNSNGVSIRDLGTSKSDTHLSRKENQSEQLARRLKYHRTAMEHVDYKDNTSMDLRKATSMDGSRRPFFWHTWVHLHRSFLQSIRDPILNNMRILIHLGFASLLVLLFGRKSGEARGCPPILGLPTEITDPDHESMIDLADNVGYLFMCLMMITYVSLMSTVLTFPIDIKTVGKEYKNGWYGTLTYFLGKSIADLPFIILYPVAYCLITWFMTGQAQDHSWRYFSFTGLIIMNAMNSQSFGLILGALFVNSVTAATFLGPVITIPWYLFTGFTKRVHRLAEPYRTTSKFLFTRYIFEGLLDTVYGHERCNCSQFLHKYYELQNQELIRIGQLISEEKLSSLDYYDSLDNVADVYNETLFPKNPAGSEWFEKTVDAASTVFADGEDLNLASLVESNGKANSLFSFGLDFEPTCPSNYRNFVVQDFRLDDSTMEHAFYYTLCGLAVIRFLTFMVVTWKIRTRQL